MKDFIKEFKEFSFKGNVLDLAVAVVIGGAFGKIVSSLVADIIMPLVGMLTGGHDVTGLKATFGTATVTYGVFLQNVIDFLLIAFSLFVAIRLINKFKPKKTPEEKIVPEVREEVKLLTEIRDQLVKTKKSSK